MSQAISAPITRESPTEPGNERIPPCEWLSRLDAFSRRSAGRIATLEVLDSALGLSGQERGYVLFGTSYDAGEDRVRIILGETHGRGQHLTRCITGATSLTVTRDAAGADVALCIEHGSGHTVLSLDSLSCHV